MNSSNTVRNYKCDVSGKSKDLSSDIVERDERTFDVIEENEIFYPVHEYFLKISMGTMIGNLNQEIVLVVSDKTPDLILPKLQDEGVLMRYDRDNDAIKYLYTSIENEGSIENHTEVLKAFLPIKSVIFEGQLDFVAKFLKENREEV